MAEELDEGVEDGTGAPEGYVVSRVKGGGYLPPINRIRMPETRTQTARVRWLFELGYSVKDISKGTGIRYQQVRNMIVTQPKRAAREDLPELRIDLLEMEDAVDMLLGMELERTFEEERKQAARKTRQSRRAAETEVDGAELDDENYGRE